MPSVYDLKPAFQRLLRPVARWLHAKGVTPNQVTAASVVLSAALGIWIWIDPAERLPLLLLPVVLFGRMALNALDGMMAREFGMATRLGTFFNELSDVIADAALYLPLATVPGMRPPLIVGTVVLAGLTEMAGVVAVQIGATRRYEGPMGKSDRAFVFGLIGLLLGLGVRAGLWVDVVLATTVVLTIATIINRARRALDEVRP